MAIIKNVGKRANNDKADAKLVQAALNLSQSSKFKLKRNLVVDGDAGAKTIVAIEQFQKEVVGLTKPDGVVDQGGKTIKSLKKHIKKGMFVDSLIAIMGKGSRATAKMYHPLFKTALPKYNIDTPLRIAHFLAQVGHESLSLIYTQELASGAAYEGRKDLGNTEKGDGVRFKGRGLIQLTGRENYSNYSKYAGFNFLKLGNERLIATTPKYALDVSLWFWKTKKLNRYADRDSIRSVTRRVNGGYNGLEDRQQYLDRAKFFLLP